ncbi:MAG: hypothetical protein V1817_01780 [Candidatus Micrarchaeota archaeon]
MVELNVEWRAFRMALSKSDLAHRKASLKAKLAALEEEALDDPLKRNRKLHEEITELKKKLEKQE